MEYEKVWLIGDSGVGVGGGSLNQRASWIAATLKAHVILNTHKGGVRGRVIRDRGGEKGYSWTLK